MYITQVVQLMAASCDLNERFTFFIHFFFGVYSVKNTSHYKRRVNF